VPTTQLFMSHYSTNAKLPIDSSTLNDRIPIWQSAIERIEKKPILGVGANNSHVFFNPKAGSDPLESAPPSASIVIAHPHSFFLQVWLELGIVGAFVFCLAGLSVILSIDDMRPGGKPYAYASFATASILASATWNMWSIWLLALYCLACIAIALADAAPDHATAGARSFQRIWLPNAIMKKFGF
jgi:exopolysaccharide production protein ExoQ